MAEAKESMTLEELINKFHEVIGKDKLKNIMQKFNGDENLEDMFNAIWAMEEAHKYLTPKIEQSKKSKEEANRLRGLGNDYLLQRDLDKALEMFNRSIMVAPHPEIDVTPPGVTSPKVQKGDSKKGSAPKAKPSNDSQGYEALSLGYARRSAVLFELQEYDLCLSDIEKANGCPKLQTELEERRKKCQTMRNDKKDATKASKSSPKTSKAAAEVPKLQQPNPIMPSFSSSCKMAYNREKGRHIIAAKNIRPGEVVLTEKALCCTTYLENLSNTCTICLTETVAPLPCPYCSMVVFCSHTCRQEGLQVSHSRECKMLPTMSALEMMPVFSNVYKLLGRRSCAQWRTILKGLDERFFTCSPEKMGMNQNEVFSSEDFDLFYSLCTNAQERPSGDLYVKCLIAFILTKILQLTGQLSMDEESKAVDPPEEDLLFIGRFLFSNMMKVSCNGANMYEYKCTTPPFKMNKRDTGAGVFPSFSLINHSCNPNVLPYFYGSHNVLRAARTLSVGDEITIGYCRGCYLQQVEDRQIYLDNVYQFECDCEACEENWPVYSDLPEELSIRCLSCSFGISEKDLKKCPRCAFDYSVDGIDEDEKKKMKEWKTAMADAKKANETIQSMMMAMMKGDSSLVLDLNSIQDAVEVLDKHVPPPSPILWDARDTIEIYFHLEKFVF